MILYYDARDKVLLMKKWCQTIALMRCICDDDDNDEMVLWRRWLWWSVFVSTKTLMVHCWRCELQKCAKISSLGLKLIPERAGRTLTWDGQDDWAYIRLTLGDGQDGEEIIENSLANLTWWIRRLTLYQVNAVYGKHEDGKNIEDIFSTLGGLW